jgi:hypothetical protein
MTSKKIKKKSKVKKKKPGFQISPDISFQETLCWGFKFLDYDGEYGWHPISFKDNEAAFKTLSSFETRKWCEVVNDTYHNHFISISNFPTQEASKRLQQLGLDDYDEIFSIRIDAKTRVYGIKDGRVLNLLWFDPEHRLYPVIKKHT